MPASKMALRTAVVQPFPGLRPFEQEDSYLFFGREKHTQELLDRLSRGRFLAVVGTSGSGKSSLVRAGLIPALFRGYLVGATTRWRIAVMRPGNSPFRELSTALSVEKVLNVPGDTLHDTLTASSFGLISVVASAGFGPGESLLLVVDQFEEIFRFGSERQGTDQAGEALLFVASILEAVDQTEIPIYVVLTMRTDFLGDCTLFPGLPEALNQCQYLIPRLSRDQQRDSIEAPIDLAREEIEPRLVQQILHDMGSDADQLPVMQHALARTWHLWKQNHGQGALSPDDYQRAGGIASALDQHADSLYESFGEAERAWTRQIFRCLTKMENGRAVRRPMRMERLWAVSGASDQGSRDSIVSVIRLFAAPGNSLLFVTSGHAPGEAIVDISHESLIRKWRRLRQWAKEEAESAEWFADLWRDTRRQTMGQADYWTGPELTRTMELKKRDAWSAAWAELYGCRDAESFGQVEAFLTNSRKRARSQNLRRYLLLGALALLAVVALIAFQEYRHRVLAESKVSALTAEQKLQQSKIGDLEGQRQSATTDNERLKIDAKLAAARSELINSLQKEIQDLKARPADGTGSTVKPNPEVERLQSQVAELRQKAQQLDELRKSVPESEWGRLPEVIQERDRLKGQLAKGQAQSSLPYRSQESGAPVLNTSASADPNVNAAPPTKDPGLVAPAREAKAPSVDVTSPKNYVLSNNQPVVTTNTGLTLMVKHMGFAPMSAELYMLAGQPGGEEAIKPFTSEDTLAVWIAQFKALMPKCSIGPPVKFRGYELSCLPVDRSKAYKGRAQGPIRISLDQRFDVWLDVSNFDIDKRSFVVKVHHVTRGAKARN